MYKEQVDNRINKFTIKGWITMAFKILPMATAQMGLL